MALELAGWRATLPPRYAPKVMGAFRQVLAAGVRSRLLEGNPAVDAGPNPEADPAPVRVYTVAELDAIAAELSTAYRPLPAFAAATRLRPEEWSALERWDVDRHRRLVKVDRRTSTRRSSPAARRRARSARCRSPATRSPRSNYFRCGSTECCFFPHPKGGPLNLDNFRKREWSPAVEAACVQTPATRTTCATRSPAPRSPPA